ncbi:MAG: baseplate J/gp47 family protein [Candidatus Levybacteria bacterium]|nr:baseplate J/gp47 family protein [Candidatus Levybacteria bacterium]
MNISTLPFLDKKEKSEYFLSLILRNEKVKAVVFEKIGTTIKYLNDSEEEFTNTIEDASTEEFLNVLDKAITAAEEVLPKDIETHKTIFGLKESWVEDNKIKKEYLEKLKKAGEELSLDPIGFLVFTESVVNLIHKDEGAPVTAILVDVGKKYLSVSLIRAGKIMEVRSSEIHESVTHTVDTVLKHFQIPEVMPARIIVLDSEEDELTQEFINHKWSKSLPFLHIPQIMSLPQDADIKAVLLGAATQMGTALIFDHNQTLSKEFAKKEDEEPEVIKTDDESMEEAKPKPFEEEKSEGKLDYVGKDSSLEFFGFSSGDVVKQAPPVAKVASAKEPLADLPKEELEFRSAEIPQDVKLEEESYGTPELAVETATKAKTVSIDVMGLLKKYFILILPLIKVRSVKDIKFIAFALGGLILALFIFFTFIFQTSAKVTLIVDPKTDEKTQSITFTPNGQTNIDDNTLGAELIPVDEEGSTTVNASGKKDIGTKAKGTVTIFNNDTDSVSLNSGTVITSSTGLKFVLDSSIKVASASGDVFSGTKPGTTNVNVTAEEIGTESNLPSGAKFTVGTSKTVAGKNDNAFSGGTKKNVTVVSDNDLAKLRSELPKTLSDKAKGDIASKVKDGRTILPQFVDTTLTKEKFDKKEDDQADKVSLSATVSFDFLSYDNKDVKKLSEKMFDNSAFSIDKSEFSVNAKNIKLQKNEDITADLVVSAKLFPNINTQDLIKQIAGTDVVKTKNMLSNLTNVKEVDIRVTPNLPFVSSTLPKNPNNITINISSN